MKASPILFTQREVDTLSAGNAAPGVRRLRSRKPATRKATAKRSGGKSAPHPISRKDMRAIRAGRFPRGLQRRIEGRPQPEPPAHAYQLTDKTAPSDTPPRRYAEPRRKKS